MRNVNFLLLLMLLYYDFLYQIINFFHKVSVSHELLLIKSYNCILFGMTNTTFVSNHNTIALAYVSFIIQTI